MTATAKFMVYAAVCALGASTLTACDPRFVHGSDLRPSEVQTLAGTWEGRASLSFSSANDCARGYQWTLRVDNGNVAGEIVDERTPNAPPARFTSFVDYDGSLHADVNAYGRPTSILGTFSRSGFSGEARASGCNYAVRLSRREGPSS